MNAKRIVIKVGSSTLTGSAGTSLNGAAVAQLVDVVAQLKESNKEVIVVTSAAIAAGMAPLGLTERPTDLATQQASASVGQGLLIAKYSAEFTRHNIVASQVLVTGDDLSRDLHKENVKRTLNRLLELGVVPIINENDSVGTAEIRFGDRTQPRHRARGGDVDLHFRGALLTPGLRGLGVGLLGGDGAGHRLDPVSRLGMGGACNAGSCDEPEGQRVIGAGRLAQQQR